MLSQRAKGLKPSPTLALAAKAKELKAEGKDVISLSVGEPDWDTFESIKQVGINAIQSGVTKYAPSNGTPEIRQAIVNQFKNDFGVEYYPNQVTVTAGAKFVIFSALQVIIDPGDEVLIPAPYWVSYPTMVELAGGIPQVVVCDSKSKFKLSAKSLQENITSKTKAVILNSPSNPTGNMYTSEEWSEIAAVLKDYPNTIIILDDIYNRLVFNDRGVAPHLLEVAPEVQDRAIVINGGVENLFDDRLEAGMGAGAGPCDSSNEQIPEPIGKLCLFI
ncbi:MAG: aminotransferase class I/II-fold pyridoxal phosphate-dependent enzyme [Bdellovibrionales bacterium]